MSQSLIQLALLIFLSIGGFIAVLVGVYYLLFAPTSVQERISRYIDIEDSFQTLNSSGIQRRDRISQFRYELNNALSVFASESLYFRLTSAYWPISVSEFILIRFMVTGVAFVIGWVIPNHILGGIGLGLLGYLMPGFMLYRSLYVRQKKFQDQLVDVLVLIRGSVQAGYSMLQSLDVVVRELPKPASEEFSRVQREVQLGLPLSQALMNLSARMESDDLQLAVTAIIINSQVGGDLTTMLSAVTETIRNRIHLFGEVRALTSYSRYTSIFLSLLPFVAVVAILFANPTYFDKGMESQVTRLIFLLAFIGMIIGNIWLRRIAKVRI